MTTCSAWQPISTAPRDGTLIDVWCVAPDDEDKIANPDFEPEHGGVRLTDVFWHDADDFHPYVGWMRCLDDGDWDAIEDFATNPLGLPPWQPTHWMPLPPSPLECTSIFRSERME